MLVKCASGAAVRECPTQKGTGKDGGKAKGKGKSYKGESFKGKGAGKSKGKGKGFAGECWNCGERGYRSNDCPNANGKSAMEIGSVGKDVNVGR